MKAISYYLVALAAVLVTGGTVSAQEQSETEVKLREALRDTMLQLRTVQNQAATLQTTEAENDRKLKDLTAKLEAANKRAVADKNAATNTISDLQSSMEELKSEIVGDQAAIAKWRKSYEEATGQAKKKEAARAELEAKSIKLDRELEAAKLRNIKMYQTGVEILDRYKRFGFGDALLAREPFVGTTRVKFQNIIQGYEDKLIEQRIQP